MTSSYVEEHVPWSPRVASFSLAEHFIFQSQYLWLCGILYGYVREVLSSWACNICRLNWLLWCERVYGVSHVLFCTEYIVINLFWLLFEDFSYYFLLSVWYILLKKRCGSIARKNLTIGTHLKTWPQKTLENKNEMGRKRPCLENKKAKLLGQAHVAREN